MHVGKLWQPKLSELKLNYFKSAPRLTHSMETWVSGSFEKRKALTKSKTAKNQLDGELAKDCSPSSLADLQGEKTQ